MKLILIGVVIGLMCGGSFAAAAGTTVSIYSPGCPTQIPTVCWSQTTNSTGINAVRPGSMVVGVRSNSSVAVKSFMLGYLKWQRWGSTAAAHGLDYEYGLRHGGDITVTLSGRHSCFKRVYYARMVIRGGDFADLVLNPRLVWTLKCDQSMLAAYWAD